MTLFSIAIIYNWIVNVKDADAANRYTCTSLESVYHLLWQAKNKFFLLKRLGFNH